MAAWFDVEGAEESVFVRQLQRQAGSWPSIATTGPLDTGGWLRPGFLITDADRVDRGQHVVEASFRVDFDGRRAMAAQVASEHVDQGSFFSGERPEGDDPVELASGGPGECAVAAAEWFWRQLAT
jgi:hypothetical protein